MPYLQSLQSLLARTILAVCLLSGAAQAWAAPLYSVSIDTATLGSGPAYLGLYFMGLADAAPATATVDNLTGALTGAASVAGTVTGTAPGPLVFGNGNGGSDWVQAITLGGMFSFDVSFALAAGDAGTTFGWALFDDAGYLGGDGDLGAISLQPGAGPGAIYQLANQSALSQVTVVPEPSTAALLLLAGVGMTWTARRRRQVDGHRHGRAYSI